MTAADVLIESLIDWGVDVAFGLPGDGVNGLMESLRTHKDQIRFVQVRHEESAAFMACGYAKFTGKLGVCLVASALEATTADTRFTSKVSCLNRRRSMLYRKPRRDR